MFNLFALGVFLFCMGGNIPLAIGAWLFFICFIKPDDWHF